MQDKVTIKGDELCSWLKEEIKCRKKIERIY